MAIIFKNATSFTILLDFTIAIVHTSVYIFLFAEYIFFRAPKVFTSQ